MNLSIKKLTDYSLQHSTLPTEVLHELERETNLKTLAPQMISGALQGQLFSILSKMMQPKAILEIGTFTGYATICLAQGLQEDGVLHTIEGNEELKYLIQKYLAKAGVDNRVQLHIGDAKEIVQTIDEEFDLVFIDAGKNDYELYYDLVFDKVKVGGFILADNVLWSGKVVQQKHDRDTRIIDAFNKKVQNDAKVENVLLPIRDGLFLIRKMQN
ncbi:MAG: O-methyltransferase [Bacteroidota bacterium]